MAKRARLTMRKKTDHVVIECSQPGFDVTTCTANQMLFSSEIDLSSALEAGAVTVGNGGTATISFSYGGIPYVSFQIASGSPARITFPALFENLNNVWADVTSSGVVFHNQSGASRVVNYQVWNRKLI